METSLHSANLTADTLDTSPKTEQEEQQEHHIHLPNPSLWPLILSVAILITMAGLLSLPDVPAVSIIGAILIIVGILGWGLEDPMGHRAAEEAAKYVPLSAQQVLEQAEEVVEHTVTVSSTAWSAHPVRVEMESAGVVLALYGKVELEAQRQEIENAVRALPGVIDVRNFIVAEDEILNIANARLENMRAKGKLDGAKNLSVLVENYILQLYGEVPNRDMKYALEREMVGIPGVRVVVNHIGLNSDIPGNLGKTRNV